MRNIPPWYYHGLQSLALWKGVLELSRMDTYVTYPYLKSQENREPVQNQLLPRQDPVTRLLTVTKIDSHINQDR